MVRTAEGVPRRSWLRCASLLAAVLLFSTCSRPLERRPPDIVILLADDLGWADVGYHAIEGSSALRTPEIDALAGAGLRLERYRTAPLCTPARAGLLSGRSPLRLGLLGNIDGADARSLPLDEELLPAAFARAGYVTAMIGKWHLGHARPEQWPNARGFETFFGFHGGWIDYSSHARNGQADFWRDARPVQEAGYSTTLFADEAVKILSDHGREKPLLLYVAFNAPHPPLHLPPGTKAGEGPGTVERRTYARMVAELDAAVGRILRAVESGPRARDTLVLFASDNGADARYGGSNAPLRDGKRTVFDGGIRAPAVLWAPGRVAAGASERLITHLDVLPTLAGLAGVRLDPPRALDGRNLWPELSGAAADAREPVAFACEDGAERRYALVDERWKIVESVRGDGPASPPQLFDVIADPLETKDAAGAQVQRLAEMHALLAPWEAMPVSAPAR
jgi:arylsulfatase A-like enzyme